eukprot:comp21279_c0_seq1/m.29035 comp21279_c0_seq1/g.29035  ORF comp21279_c0_seq1/g.29035 comp21279_c0_seq1/m.29035 type:complete len:115 (-) comp21279_c0_seq1:645-989(-)
MIAFLQHKCSGCNVRATFKEKFRHCQCDMAYYCSAECQRKDWPSHRKTGKHCANCRKGGNNLPRQHIECSCTTVVYCSPECQEAHWVFHCRVHVPANKSPFNPATNKQQQLVLA